MFKISPLKNSVFALTFIIISAFSAGVQASPANGSRQLFDIIKHNRQVDDQIERERFSGGGTGENSLYTIQGDSNGTDCDETADKNISKDRTSGCDKPEITKPTDHK